MSTTPSSPSGSTEPLVLADHPALDLLNTIAKVDGQDVDFWRSDADVDRWLRRVEMRPEDASAPPKKLLAAGIKLRELIRGLVEQRKAGEEIDPAELNEFLRQCASYSQLVMDGEDGPYLERVHGGETAAQCLAPVAEAAASLLAEGDFELVRECEHPDCSLWFYDRTKSHRRRWCSMAVCGNRHKVAEFRKRSAE
jgi:predicted RNA-binding Zn ribbon-like protein